MEILDRSALELALKIQDWNEGPFLSKLKVEHLVPLYRSRYSDCAVLPMTMDRKPYEVQFLGIAKAHFSDKIYCFEITTPKEARAYIYYAPRKGFSKLNHYLYFSMSSTLYDRVEHITDSERIFGMNVATVLRQVLE